jgi:hypothetical protein
LVIDPFFSPGVSGSQPHLSELGIPLTQNFEIPLKTQESKNFEISFENFQKMLDGSKFGKRCFLGIFFNFGKFKIFFKNIKKIKKILLC